MERKNNNLIIFTLFIVFLFLLRSAGYFQPYFPISVNFIIMVAIVLSYFILKIKSKMIFLIGLIFWIFAGFLRTVRIDIWSERTGIYVYESLFLAVLFNTFEVIINKGIKSKTVNEVIIKPIKKLLGW
jgi:hypothetical protein